MSRPLNERFGGLVERRRCQLTGFLVGLYDGVQSGIESDPETPWVTVCEEHGNCVCHRTQKLARSHMAVPEWCEECQEIMKQKGVLA
jgi:hypothetical protein